ncbi:relaxin-3-like [Engraulis encrasicolus]|uniref:relaxin-3-like n=1 Tax=Engraulis encrasicolus TaxID=184585 RepID=UPI002FD1B7D1
MMWRGVVLAACLFLIGCEALPGSAQYGVKLCGREFIRAIIFTCGGSRWRRADLLEDPLGLVGDDEHADLWLADTNAPASTPLAQETEGAVPEELLLAPDWWRQQGGMFARLSRSQMTNDVPESRPSRSQMTNDILDALRNPDRKGRGQVVGLSNACCKWGCSKTEISSLC